MKQALDKIAAWRPKRKTQERLIGGGTVLLLLALLFTLAATTSLNEQGHGTRVIEFMTAVVTPSPAPTAATGATAATPVDPVSAPDPASAIPARQVITMARTAPLTAPARAQLQRENVEASVLEVDVGVDPTISQHPRQPVAAQVTDAINPRAVLEQVRAGRGGGPPSVQGPSVRMPGPEPGRLNLPDVNIPVEREVDAPVPAPEVAPDDVAPPLTDQHLMDIRDWVGRYPADLPPVVARHMDMRDGDLTSWVETEGGTLYLGVRSHLDQVHILLVQSDTSYYFVDRGFQEEVSRFRLGDVRRNGNLITQIISQEQSPGSAAAGRLYATFLSWWHNRQQR